MACLQAHAQDPGHKFEDRNRSRCCIYTLLHWYTAVHLLVHCCALTGTLLCSCWYTAVHSLAHCRSPSLASALPASTLTLLCTECRIDAKAARHLPELRAGHVSMALTQLSVSEGASLFQQLLRLHPQCMPAQAILGALGGHRSPFQKFAQQMADKLYPVPLSLHASLRCLHCLLHTLTVAFCVFAPHCASPTADEPRTVGLLHCNCAPHCIALTVSHSHCVLVCHCIALTVSHSHCVACTAFLTHLTALFSVRATLTV